MPRLSATSPSFPRKMKTRCGNVYPSDPHEGHGTIDCDGSTHCSLVPSCRRSPRPGGAFCRGNQIHARPCALDSLIVPALMSRRACRIRRADCRERPVADANSAAVPHRDVDRPDRRPGDRQGRPRGHGPQGGFRHGYHATTVVPRWDDPAGHDDRAADGGRTRRVAVAAPATVCRSLAKVTKSPTGRKWWRSRWTSNRQRWNFAIVDGRHTARLDVALWIMDGKGRGHWLARRNHPAASHRRILRATGQQAHRLHRPRRVHRHAPQRQGRRL